MTTFATEVITIRERTLKGQALCFSVYYKHVEQQHKAGPFY